MRNCALATTVSRMALGCGLALTITGGALAQTAITGGQTLTGELTASDGNLNSGAKYDCFLLEALPAEPYQIWMASDSIVPKVSIGPGRDCTMALETNSVDDADGSDQTISLMGDGGPWIIRLWGEPQQLGYYTLGIQTAPGLTDEAACLYDKGPPTALIAACERFLGRGVSDDARRVAGMVAKAKAQWRKNSYGAALVSFRQAEAIDPELTGFAHDYAMGLVDYAVTVVGDDDLGQQFDLFEKAIQIDPEYGLLYSNRGNIYRRWELYGDARVDLDRGVALDPRSPYAYYARALLNFNEGDTESGQRDLDRALQLNPQYENALWEKTYQAYAAGDYNQALTLANQTLTNYPNNGMVLRMRGESKAMLNDYYGAIADLDRAHTLVSGSLDSWNRLGFAHSNLGDDNAALIAFEKALTFDPQSQLVQDNIRLTRNNLQQGQLYAQQEQARQQCLERERQARQRQESQAWGAILGGVLSAAAGDNYGAQQQLNSVNGQTVNYNC